MIECNIIHRKNLYNFLKRYYCSSMKQIISKMQSSYPKPVIDVKKSVAQLNDLQKSVILRRSINNDTISEINNILKSSKTLDSKSVNQIENLLLQLPNKIHPEICNYTEDFKVLNSVGVKKDYPFKPLSGTDILKSKDLIKIEGLNKFCGDRAYYFLNDAAKLEQALINYTVQKLINKGFQLISVPDILTDDNIERCGMPTKGIRTQIYRLSSDVYGEGWSLSGTSEMALPSLFMNLNLDQNRLPMYFTAVSRCYRAEISLLATEKGIYRVHQFTKVEMFSLCLPEQSSDTLDFFRSIQEELFSSYDLHYRVIDMAPHELGQSAYRKYDIEAWMPGSDKYGEISSCSDCTDYQSRRFNIRCNENFLHTVNGTACAVPRTANAILETHQIAEGRVIIPDALRPYLKQDVFGMKRGPNLHKIRQIPKNLSKYHYFLR